MERSGKLQKHLRSWPLLAIILLISWGCKEGDSVEPKGNNPVASGFGHPEWVWKSNIYEVNVRQYTPEGNFKAFSKHLTRLKEMGIDVLWLVPIHPIGVKNRKGKLGSYYSVKDYKAVNPEFGTLEDFKDLVRQAHDLGMYVIIDWVANHTAWDNAMINDHPDWYTHDSTGKIIPPVKDWADVADLNYDSPELQEYMIGAMEYWVETADIDGFRCDVAEMVPMSFWDKAVERLKQRKNVFMLAEAEGPKYHKKAFNMDYAWEMHHVFNDLAKDKKSLMDFTSLLENQRATFPGDAIRMNFTSNHDENTWNGTVWERMGNAAYPLAVLACTMEGMPLVYSGQEAGLDKRLAFFDKDTISWKDHKMGDIYTKLLNLRHDHPALWALPAGGEMVWLDCEGSDKVLAFVRMKDKDMVAVFLNLERLPVMVKPMGDMLKGDYLNVITGKKEHVEADTFLTFQPWGYKVFVNSQ